MKESVKDAAEISKLEEAKANHVDENRESNGNIGWIVGGVFFLILGFALYQVNLNAWDIKPNADGSFPLSSAATQSFPMLASALIILFMMVCLIVPLIGEEKLKSGAKIVLSFFVVVGAMVLAAYLLKFSDEMWDKSLKTWVSSEYGIEYDHVTESFYPGIVGKAGFKGSPNIYIDPPRNFRYLTSKEGKYLAELIPDTFVSDSVRVYKISNGNTPELLPKK